MSVRPSVRPSFLKPLTRRCVPRRGYGAPGVAVHVQKPHLSLEFLVLVPWLVVSVVLDYPLVDALQPESLAVQVARPGGGRPAGEHPRQEAGVVPEEDQLSVAFDGFGQARGEAVQGLVDLRVHLERGGEGAFCLGDKQKLNGWNSDVPVRDPLHLFALHGLMAV